MEQPEITTHPTRARRSVKVTDIIIGIVIFLVIVLLINTLMHQLALKNEVSGARTTTDKMVTYIRNKDATAAHNLGDESFQKENETDKLAKLFDSLGPIVKPKSEVVKQTANSGKSATVVSIYYKFSGKTTYYLRVTVKQPNGKTNWQLINFSGSPTLDTLIKL